MKNILIILFAFAFSNGYSQSVAVNSVCYGDPIYLVCNYSAGCSDEAATYTWSNFSGSWTSDIRNPVLNPPNLPPCTSQQFSGQGYSGDKFYLSIQFTSPPNSFFGGRVTLVLLPEILTSAVITDNVCSSSNIGQINFSVSGGTPPYTYLWSNGATTQDLTGLSSDTYTVTVTCATSCKKISSYIVGSTYTDISAVKHDTYCRGNNGAINLVVDETCLIPPFSYIWSNGATSKNINGLSPGSYTVTVTDAIPSSRTLTTIIE